MACITPFKVNSINFNIHLKNTKSYAKNTFFPLNNSASGIPGEICTAVDINTTANQIYQHNHPKIKVLSNNIQKLQPKDIFKMEVNTILMSPPCQPFTRVGNKKDIDDARTNALVHICSILPDLHTIDYILMENVKGFETSLARDLYIKSLESSGFEYQEFLLSPTEIGVPNTRFRYYCLARRSAFPFKSDKILTRLPNTESKQTCQTVEEFLKDVDEPFGNDYTSYLLGDDNLMKRAGLLDIKHSVSTNTICFTKAYTHYAEGTGSVFCPGTEKELKKAFAEIKEKNMSPDERLTKLKSLKLRYFTPREVARLMSFPNEFTFPIGLKNKQQYRVLGNSINVAIVGKLIEILCKDNVEPNLKIM